MAAIEPTGGMSSHEDVLDRVPLRFLVGPTASGKSGLAIALAEESARSGRPLEIVSLDSMNVYRGLDIGTAKPTAADRQRVPHHLIDVADPRRRFDLQSYITLVRVALESMEERGAQPLFAGGTGLYLAALLRGVFQGPEADLGLREALQARAATEGLARLREELKAIDAESAERIHSGDERRTIRALEVYMQTGIPMSVHQAQWRAAEPPARQTTARLAGLQMPTDELDERIRTRTAEMLAHGWPDEANRLHAAGALGPSASQALGYETAAAVARGELDAGDAASLIALRTRQFARRQRTWFRKFEIEWVDPRSADAPGDLRTILDL